MSGQSDMCLLSVGRLRAQDHPQQHSELQLPWAAQEYAS